MPRPAQRGTEAGTASKARCPRGALEAPLRSPLPAPTRGAPSPLGVGVAVRLAGDAETARSRRGPGPESPRGNPRERGSKGAKGAGRGPASARPGPGGRGAGGNSRSGPGRSCGCGQRRVQGLEAWRAGALRVSAEGWGLAPRVLPAAEPGTPPRPDTPHPDLPPSCAPAAPVAPTLVPDLRKVIKPHVSPFPLVAVHRTRSGAPAAAGSPREREQRPANPGPRRLGRQGGERPEKLVAGAAQAAALGDRPGFPIPDSPTVREEPGAVLKANLGPCPLVSVRG